MYVQLVIIVLGFLALKWYPQVGSEKNQVRQHKRYIVFMMVLLTLQSGLRHVAVGSDTFAYYNTFLVVQNSSWNILWQDCLDFFYYGEGKDPGYYLALKAIQLILPTYQLYLIGLAAFVFYGLGKILCKFTRSNYEILLAMALYQCLYYSFFSITGHRQTMATGFLFLALPYVLKRKPVQFCLLVLISATQHKSALLFAPFYFLPLLKVSKTMLVGSLALFVPMWIWGGKIAGYMMMSVSMDQYANYLVYYDGAGAYGFAAFILLLGISLLLSHQKIVSEENNTAMILNAVAVAIILTPLTMINPSNMRIVQYYSIFGLIALPWAIKNMSISSNVKDSYNLIVIFLAIYTIMRNSPYAFFWQDMALGANYL